DLDPWSIISMDENTIETKPRSEVSQIASNHFFRVYPRGGRVDSSNYSPFSAWRKGCQLVALNWQAKDGIEFCLQLGMFGWADRCGYVLKPRYLRSCIEEDVSGDGGDGGGVGGGGVGGVHGADYCGVSVVFRLIKGIGSN